MFSDVAFPFVLGFAVAAGVGFLIGSTGRWHGAFSHDSADGPHKFHDSPTPRIGGLAVCAGYWAAAAAAPAAARDLLFVVGAVGAIVLLAGAAEDLTRRVGVGARLGATMLAGAVFCFATGSVVTHLEIPLVDRAMALPFVAVAFTAFAMAGLTHAINIVDGFHGLATGTAVVMLVAFAIVAHGAGDRDMALFCLAAAAAPLGFLPVNFPFGRVFLGDGGAYFLGFVLAAAAVMIPMRNPDVSPWVSLVVLAYPVLEVGFSVVRKLRNGRRPTRPDDAHLHMLVYRSLGKALAGAAGNERLANPATGAAMWGGAAAGLAAVALVPHDREWSLGVLALMFALYALAYRKAARARPGLSPPLRASGSTAGDAPPQPRPPAAAPARASAPPFHRPSSDRDAAARTRNEFRRP